MALSSPISASFVFITLLSTLVSFVHPKVSMWIGEDEVRAFAGVPMEISIIDRDKLADYVRRGPEFTSGLPPIPPLADSINVTWTSGKGKGPKGKYSYKFLHIKAEDPSIMEGLKLSISHSGMIPRRPTDFRVSLPCTGLKAGIANFKLVFEVSDQSGKPLEGSPIRLKLAKYCRLQNETCLVQKCAHGGVCTPYGDCLCQKGFVGRRCEHSANCRNDCNRRGVCIRDDICKCRPGFRGKYCQKRSRNRGTSSGKKGGKGGKRNKGGKKEAAAAEASTAIPPRFTNEVEVYGSVSTPAPRLTDVAASDNKRKHGKKKKSRGKKKNRKDMENNEDDRGDVEKLGDGDAMRKKEEASGEKAGKKDRKVERKERRKNRRRKKQQKDNEINNVTLPAKV